MRRQGKVLCQDDYLRAGVAASEARLEGFLQQVATAGEASFKDPIALSLGLIWLGMNAPKEGSWPYFGTPREDSPVALQRRDRVRAAMRSALPEHAAFDVDRRTARIEVVDPHLVAQWVFNQRHLAMVDIGVSKRLTAFWHQWRYLPKYKVVDHIPAARLVAHRETPSDKPGYLPDVTPGKFLLPNGKICNGSLAVGWEDERLAEDWSLVAEALKLHRSLKR